MCREGFHEVQRKFAHNFALITPKSKNPDEIEGGLLFEMFLWGTYEIKYWEEKHCRNVLNIDVWKNGG